MTLWLVFLMLSMVFTLGWVLGSGIGYQSGQRDAEEAYELRAELFRDLQRHLAVEDTETRVAVPG